MTHLQEQPPVVPVFEELPVPGIFRFAGWHDLEPSEDAQLRFRILLVGDSVLRFEQA